MPMGDSDKESFTVTPWEVSGQIDYEKLIERFGTSRITPALLSRIEKTAGSLHHMLRRGYFYSHRDMDLALNDYEKGAGFFLYTGRGPSGPMHIGHMIPLAFTKWLQDKFKANLYIQISDDEKYLVRKGMEWADIEKHAHDNILDIIAAGFDPERTFIFRNTEFAGKMYKTALEVSRRTTLSTAKAVFGFTDSSNIGSIFYTSMQAVPAFFEKRRALIPSAIDQDPYWRVQRDVAESIGFMKASAIHSKFLPPLAGVTGKMSSSAADSAIWLSDSPQAVKKKVNKYAFSGGKDSVEEHRRLGGDPDIDVAYQWMSIYFEPDDAKLKQMHDDYKSGKMLSGEMKAALIERINADLEAHRARRAKAEELIHTFMHDGALARKAWGK
jgi:tryptophanyl-tRNA synthetase